MTTMSCTGCPFCAKAGLPILPTRYAVSRSDRLAGPSLQGEFRQDVDLPDTSAHYTLRLLRQGYLYVYDDGLEEWSAYAVTDGGHLWQFDIDATPPDVNQEKPCSRGSDPYIARCITVSDVQSAKNLWLGFSDVPWTDAVLEKHQDEAYRKAHMRCVDVQGWVTGSKVKQPHTAPFDNLPDRVAEFSVDDAMVSHVLLQGVLDDIFKRGESPVPTLASSAFGFSLFPFRSLGEQAEPLQNWAAQTAADMKQNLEEAGVTEVSNLTPLIAGLEDPVGMAVDLNALISQRLAEWSEQDKKRQWAHTTASSIKVMEQVIRRQTIADERQDRQVYLEQRYKTEINPPPYKQWLEQYQHKHSVNIALSGDEREAVGDSAWRAYTDEYNAEQMAQSEQNYRVLLKAFDKGTITPLSTAYLAWIDSQKFKVYFSHNFDPEDGDSGKAYTALATLCIKDACGRVDVHNAFRDKLKNDPGDRSNVLVRALVFDQNQLAGDLATAVSLGAAPGLQWQTMGASLQNAMKQVFGGDGPSDTRIKGVLNLLAAYTYGLGGPVAATLNEGMAQDSNGNAQNTSSVTFGSKLTIDDTPEQRRLLALLSLLSWQEIESKTLYAIPVQAHLTDEQRDWMLTQLMEGYGQQPRSINVPAPLADGPTKPFRWIAVLDEASAWQCGLKLEADVGWQDMGGVIAKLGHAISHADTKTDFGKGVVGMFFAAIGLAMNFEDKILKGTAVNRTHFAVASVAMLAGVAEVVGIAGQNVSFMMKNSAIVARYLDMQVTRANALRAAGKFIAGGIGIVFGFSEAIKGWNMRDVNQSLAYTHMAAGLATAALGFLAIFSSITGGTFLVAVFVIAGLKKILIDDHYEEWLGKCYFGAYGERYETLIAQQNAFKELFFRRKENTSAEPQPA